MVYQNKLNMVVRKKKDVEEELVNSDDEYSYQSGGTNSDDKEDISTETDTELGSDSDHLDKDPDDEQSASDGPDDENNDGEYDPVENEELEDNDSETEEKEEEEGEEEGEEEESSKKESKTCHIKKKTEDDYMILDEDDSNMYGNLEYVKISDENRQTDSILTNYEMVRIIGTRAQQFNLGAEPLIKGIDGLHPAKKAYLELKAHMTPFIIRRFLPGKKYEDWKIDELELIHEITDDFFVEQNAIINTVDKK